MRTPVLICSIALVFMSGLLAGEEVAASRAAPKPTKLDIVCLPNGSDAFATNVFCTASTAKLTPVTSEQINVADGNGLALLTINTSVTGVTASPVTIATTATLKTDLKNAQTAFKTSTSGSETQVSVGKAGAVSFKATIKYPDGSASKASFTTVNGTVTKDAWSTANKLAKTSLSWKEDGIKGTISVKQTVFLNNVPSTFSGSFVSNASTKASLKKGKETFTGTAAYDPASGVITFNGKSKAGATATYKYDPNTAGGPTSSLNGVASSPIFNSTGVKSATTPNPRRIEQNMPPVFVATQPPVINSLLTAGGTVGTPITTYMIAATNSPTGFNATGLPPGLSVDTSNGQITGTPTTTAGSPFSVTISATNAGGTGTATLVFTINPAAPVINSTLTASGTQGTITTYTISATNNPSSFDATNLPPGLSVDKTSGQITGTPTTTAGSPFSVTISATNAGGTGSATLVFTINPPAPVINSLLTASGTVGTPITTYAITGTNTPTSFNATGLPPGLVVSTTTGDISGTPSAGADAGSPYSVSISATNAGGTGTATLSFTILPAAPAINSSLTDSGFVGNAYSYTITASNNPTSFNATGLPSGLSVNTGTGTISGTPAAGSETGSPYSVSISATNAGGTDTQTLSLTITVPPPAPVIGGTLTATAKVGNAFSYFITATNTPTSFNATGLPSGLVVNFNTGEIFGAPDVGTDTGSPYSVTISATNAGGTGSDTLVLTVNP